MWGCSEQRVWLISTWSRAPDHERGGTRRPHHVAVTQAITPLGEPWGERFHWAGGGSRGAGQGRTPRQMSCCCSYCPGSSSPHVTAHQRKYCQPLGHTSLHTTSLHSSVLADPLLIPSISYTRFVGGIQTPAVSHATEHTHTVLNRRTFTNDALWAGSLHSRHVIYNMGVRHPVRGPRQEPDLIPRAHHIPVPHKGSAPRSVWLGARDSPS